MKANDKEKNKKNKKFYKILFIVFLIGLGISLGIMGHSVYRHFVTKDKLSDLTGSNTGNGVEETETEKLPLQSGVVIPERNLDWEELKKTNEHIYAWIYIPNTQVDYPIVQHPEDDTFYLRRDLEGKKNTEGTIFSEATYNNTEFTDFNTVLYGHNMKAKTMFATLHNFEDADFFEANRYVYIYTPDKVLVYDIFAAYEFSNKHILAYYSTISDGGKQRYIDEIFGIRDMRAHYRDDIDVTLNSHILTLSTCVRGDAESRYLVQAVLIE